MFSGVLQISDFLSGRSPLTIKLGIGAHMMYVQLQLSAQDVKDLQAGEVRCKAEQRGEYVSHPGSGSAWPTGFTASPAVSTSPVQANTQRPRTSFTSAAPTSHSSSTTPAVSHHQSSPHTSPRLSGCPHPSCPPPAATPVCSPAASGSSRGPRSPAPASTCTKVIFLLQNQSNLMPCLPHNVSHSNTGVQMPRF